jgi:integrase
VIRKQGSGYGVRVHEGGGRQRWLGTFPTKALAKQAERDYYLTHRPGKRMTVDAWAGAWLELHPRPSVTTAQSYKYAAAQVARDFKGVSLDAVDRVAARAWALKQPHFRVRVARTMFADAMRDGLVHANPFTDLRLETPKGRRDIQPLSRAELHELADLALEVHGPVYGPEFRALLLFAGYTGIRPGEYRRLEWPDISEEAVTVRASIAKTQRARTVYLPPPAAEALRSYPRRVDSPFVFHSKMGKPLQKGALDYAWRLVRERANRPDMDIYELRHVCATMLIEAGVSREAVALQLGHRNTRLVDELYGHPSEEWARQGIAKVFEADVVPLKRGINEAQPRRKTASQKDNPGS